MCSRSGARISRRPFPAPTPSSVRRRNREATMGRRRLNGDGTVYPTKDGRWRGRLFLGYRPDGNPEHKYVSARTRAEADAKLEDLKRQRDGGIDITGKLKVG